MMTIGISLVPSISAMGIIGPAGLMSAQVTSNVVTTTAFHRKNPEVRFRSMLTGMGHETGGPFRLLPHAADSEIVTLGHAPFPIDGSKPGDRLVLELGVKALAAAEARLDEASKPYPRIDTPGWLTSSGIFTEIEDLPELSLLVLLAIRTTPIRGVYGSITSPSIAAQRSVDMLLGVARTVKSSLTRGQNGEYIIRADL